MSDKTGTLPKSALDAMNDMLERFCPAEGPGFLRCARARGHEGAHYDVIRSLEWGSNDAAKEPGDE